MKKETILPVRSRLAARMERGGEKPMLVAPAVSSDRLFTIAEVAK